MADGAGTQPPSKAEKYEKNLWQTVPGRSHQARRKSKENLRKSKENPRKSKENVRKSKENQWKSKKNTRKSKENTLRSGRGAAEGLAYVCLLFLMFPQVWASILVTRMLVLPAGMPTPWQEAQHPSL